MSVVIAMKAIKPKRLQVDKIRLEILNELRKEATVHRKELEKTVSKWKGDKPKFESAIGLDKGAATVITGPAGNDKGVQKWIWLDEGTKKRWAVMSSDWQSKTRPRKFGNRAGRGKVAIWGKKFMLSRGIPARPGIKAREWTKLLTQRRRRPFTRRMIKAMRRAGSKAF